MKDIDLNTASREDLMEVRGVDYILADNIIGFREEHGGIDSVDELRALPGMDDTTFQELRAAAGETSQTEWVGEEEEEEW